MLAAYRPGYQITILMQKRYSKLLTLGIIRMHLTPSYDKTNPPCLSACWGGDGDSLPSHQQWQTDGKKKQAREAPVVNTAIIIQSTAEINMNKKEKLHLHGCKRNQKKWEAQIARAQWLYFTENNISCTSSLGVLWHVKLQRVKQLECFILQLSAF